MRHMTKHHTGGSNAVAQIPKTASRPPEHLSDARRHAIPATNFMIRT